jgi:predicted PhzF superfamily epimerase YddE/YHI9
VRHSLCGERPFQVQLEQGHAIARPSLLHVRATANAIEVGGRVIHAARGEWL